MPSLLAIVCFCLLSSLVKATGNGGSLYFTNLNSIQLLNNNLSTVVLGDLEQAESLDCNVCDQRIYWVDMLGKIKKGIPNNQSSIEVVIDKDLRHPIGLAVDWKGNNVYFSDERNAQRQGRIEVTSCNGRQRKVLLHNLGSPGPLALNLLTGHLYYVDELDIKRISADGSGNPQTVYLEYIHSPKDLAVDVINNLLYWTVGDHILYLNMTHWETLTQTQRDLIVPETVRPGFAGVVPHSISVVNNTIYWTEDRQVNQENHEITRPGAIYSLSLPTNTSQILLQNKTLSPQDLSTFINISVHRDGCAINNGNCQHFCFTVPDGNGGTRPQCGCPTGIKLHSDNRTCPEVPSQFLIFTQNFHNRTEIRRISLDIPGKFIDTLVPIDDLGADVSFLSYDLVLHQIYWTEVNPPAIKRAYANGTGVETFIGTGLKHPEGIAVDSYSRNLYWVDSALNRIEVARLSNSKNRRVLFSSRLDHPQGLALDLSQRYMYWTDLDTAGPKVERAHMDGTGRMNLPNVQYTIKTPTNIAVDPLTRWVYWSETGDSVERVSRYNGSRDFSLSLRNTGNVLGLAIHGDYIYWTDRSQSNLVRAQKSTGDGEYVILAGYPGLLGLVAVNSTAETVSTGCRFNYGNCKQLCLPSETTSPTCSCRDNFIVSNGNQCIDPAPNVYISTEAVVAPFEVTLTNSEHWRRSQSPPFNITASAIDIDYRDSKLYWISSVDKQIYRQFVNLTSTSELEAVVTCCLVTPEDLAVDWLGRNLYWTDSNRRVIEVAKLDGGGRTILAHVPKSIAPPSFIALDSTRGHLYWVPKSQATIYKMQMDGSSTPNSKVFWSSVSPTAQEKIIGLAINYEETPNDVIYWGTQTTDTPGVLWKRELTGSPTVLNIKMLDDKPLHIATFKYNVYYHYQRPRFGDFISSYNSQQQSDNQVLSRGNRGNLINFTDFIIAHHSQQPGIHECSVLNHGCGGHETLCLISNSLDGVCQCPPTMVKQVDQDPAGQKRETCISASSLLLIATQEAIHYLPIPPNVSPSISRPLPIGPLYDVSAVAYDPVNKSVLWIDRETQFLNRATVDGRQFWNIREIANVSAFSMTYDWMGGQVFLTEDQGFQIELVTVNGEGVGSLLLHDVQQTRILPRPGDIAFDVDDSILYWTALSRNGDTIWNMSLTNTSDTRRLDINISGIQNISKLTFEPLRKSLYWINTNNATIERYDLRTKQLSTVAGYAANVTALAAVPVNDQPFVFWYNNSDRSIYRSNGQPMNYTMHQKWSGPTPIVDFVGSTRSQPTAISDACLTSSRPCSHLCIQQSRSPFYSCRCPPYRRLNPNGTCSDLTCEGVLSSCNDGFSCYPTSYYCDGLKNCRNGFDEECSCETTTQRGCSHSPSNCVPIDAFCNGTNDCPEGEDEELAPQGSCCPENKFRCRVDGFQICVEQDLVCDGMEDCDDGEDERDCPSPTTPQSTTLSATTTTTSSDSSPPSSIQTPIIIATSTFFAALLIILLLFAVCVSARCIHKKRGGYNATQIGHQMTFKPSSSPSENDSLNFSECGTHSTQLDIHGSNLSPSSFDSNAKRRSITALSTDPSVPPPSLITDRHSAFLMTDIREDVASEYSQSYSNLNGNTPRVPNPSLNYSMDAMSSASFSVSQRNFPAAINGTDPHTHIHTHNHQFRRNPLLSQHHHYQQHAHHFFSRPPHHLHHPHFVRQQRERLDTMSDTDSTMSMTTLNTENQDDLPPPGRPPTPATMTEFSGYHPHSLSPSSPISDDSEQCSENFLHRD